METNDEIMAAVSAALKGNMALKGAMTLTTLGESVLNPEQFNQFVQVLQEPTTLLKDARRLDLINGRANIDRIGFAGRISKTGGTLATQAKTAIQTVTALTSGDAGTPGINTNKLNGREFVALVQLQDATLKRNIERGNFEQTLIQLIGDAAGKDMEENAALCHLDYTGSVSGLNLFDGWIEAAGNAVYGKYGDKSAGLSTTIKSATPMSAGSFILSTTADLTTAPAAGTFFRVGVVGSATEEYFTVASKDSGDDTITFTTPAQFAHAALEPVVQIDALPAFNPEAAAFPENMFDAMIEAVPKKYFGDLTRWAFYVPWEVANAYQDLLKARGTALGDQATTEKPVFKYKGITVKYTPIIDRSETYNGSTAAYGRVALLSNKDNLAWGIERDVRIEPQRDALSRLTNFVLSYSMDAGYEDEDASCAAFLDVPAPAA